MAVLAAEAVVLKGCFLDSVPSNTVHVYAEVYMHIPVYNVLHKEQPWHSTSSSAF